MRGKLCVPFRKLNNWIKRNIAKYIYPEIKKITGQELYDRIKKYPNSI